MQNFIKHNATSFPDALLREADGLRLLADTLAQAGVADQDTSKTVLRVLPVERVSERELVLPQINVCSATPEHATALGEGLAKLHRVAMPQYGLDQDNMIGLSRQYNAWADHWGQFFIEHRLQPQVRMIRDASVRRELEQVLSDQQSVLADFLNEHCEHPSLLHGDLWAGNVLYDENGPWLIDPAVYCGDREADLAMTELFGGFSSSFYRAYDAIYPRTSAYETKVPIYNLYHALNHYNLFGSGYLGLCRRNLEVIRLL